MQRKKYSAKR